LRSTYFMPAKYEVTYRRNVGITVRLPLHDFLTVFTFCMIGSNNFS